MLKCKQPEACFHVSNILRSFLNCYRLDFRSNSQQTCSKYDWPEKSNVTFQQTTDKGAYTYILCTQKLIFTLSQMWTKTVHNNFLQRLPFAWHSPSLFWHLHSHYAQKYHETQWGYPLKTGRDMDFFPRKCKGSTSKDNSANSWGTLQIQVQKPRMIKALRSEAEHWREELGIKYEICIERKPVGKKRFHSKLQPKLYHRG